MDKAESLLRMVPALSAFIRVDPWQEMPLRYPCVSGFIGGKD